MPTLAADVVRAESDLYVLIAEDEAASRLLLTRTLESWGYRVSVARDGTEAWPITASDQEIHVTASIGIATTTTPQGTDHQTVIADADRALYRAKAGGRNRVELGGGEPPA